MEALLITGNSKIEKYQELLPQLEALWAGEPDLIANMANTAAALMATFQFHWVGFYLVKEDALVLGPFQGPVACTRIGFGKGVCGHAWQAQQTILVPDVEKFPGHIACSALSRSEIVVPVWSSEKSPKKAVIAVLDVDSEWENHFDETDKAFLEKLCFSLSKTI